MTRRERPPKGTLRLRKVAQAKRKMFQLVDDPVAIAATVDTLLDELCPDNNFPQGRRLKLAS